MQPIIRLFPYLSGAFLCIFIALLTLQFTLSNTSLAQKVNFQPIQTTVKISSQEKLVIDSFQKAHTIGINHNRHKVNFDHQMIVGITMGSRATGGYAIRITDVIETPYKIYVQTEQSSPSSGTLTTQAFNYPQDFVTIPKTNKRIIFLD